jgi:hypothetical protein
MPLDLDLDAFAGELGGDPAAFFLDADGRDAPLVVRHADGVACFRVEARSGSPALVPLGAPPAQALSFEAAPGRLALAISVTDPPAEKP